VTFESVCRAHERAKWRAHLTWLEDNAPRCGKGHVKNRANLKPGGKCRACAREYDRQREQRFRGNHRTWFPSQPLLDLIEHQSRELEGGFYILCKQLGLNGQSHKRDRFHYQTVDRICCRLGVHPMNVYPEWCEAA
jgi:hypothetical protein